MNLGLEHQLRTRIVHIVAHDKRGVNRARLEQVWMIAHFSELHEHIHNTEEV